MPSDQKDTGRTILIVDDSERIRMLVRAILAETGWNILEASSAEEALSAADGRSGAPDLLLTDLKLPGISGLDLAERLLPSNPHLKVLCMSGHALPAASHRGVHFIEKPFQPQTLLAKVRELLA